MTCTECGIDMFVEKRRCQTINERRHAARGLCTRCYKRAREGYERRVNKWAEVADDYAMLRDQGYRLRDIADRLGMTFVALDRMLSRNRQDERSRRPASRSVA